MHPRTPFVRGDDRTRTSPLTKGAGGSSVEDIACMQTNVKRTRVMDFAPKGQ